MYSYFQKDAIFSSDLYRIYDGSPCKSYTDRLHMLYVLLIKFKFVWYLIVDLNDEEQIFNASVISELILVKHSI